MPYYYYFVFIFNEERKKTVISVEHLKVKNVNIIINGEALGYIWNILNDFQYIFNFSADWHKKKKIHTKFYNMFHFKYKERKTLKDFYAQKSKYSVKKN